MKWRPSSAGATSGREVHRLRTSGLGLVLLALGCASNSAAARPGLSAPALSRSFVELSDQVFGAVVHVQASGYAPADAPGGQVLRRVVGAGSGVAVSKDGFILTNAHVVQWASEVRVRVTEGPEAGRPADSILRPKGDLLPARVVGVDPETDLAVLAVEHAFEQVLEFGDSDEVKPGQLVFAFGSPRGLEGSVTMGIVSAAGRQLKPEGSVVYIQTDAPINPGNSGGPLVDAQGRLIGINTLIFSSSGGSDGLGFSLPSNIAQTVYEQLRAQGAVRRGIIGATTQTISPALARGLGLARTWGVVVADVFPGSPAAAGDLQPGDVILALEGKPMENARQFEVNIYHQRIGSDANVEILRGEERKSLRIPVVERPQVRERLQASFDPATHLVSPLGILAMTIDDRIRPFLPNLREPTGVITAVAPSDHQLANGDIIHAVNGEAVETVEALRSQLAGAEPGGAIVLRVERGGTFRYVTIDLER